MATLKVQKLLAAGLVTFGAEASLLIEQKLQ